MHPPLRWLWFVPVLFAAIFVLAYISKFFSPNRGDVKLYQAQELINRVSPYPDSEVVETSAGSKDRIATVGRAYKSKASYEDLKRYYSEKLATQGWRYETENDLFDWGRNFGGRRILFRQGQFQLVIEYAGRGADYGWDYAVNITWQA